MSSRGGDLEGTAGRDRERGDERAVYDRHYCRLVPDRLAGRQKDGSWIGKAADTIQRAEVMIEGAVLLHQDDDVFDVEDAARVSVGNDR